MIAPAAPPNGTPQVQSNGETTGPQSSGGDPALESSFADILKILDLIQEMTQKLQKAAKNSRTIQRDSNYSTLMTAAAQDLKAAGKALVGAIIGGTLGMMGGVAGLGSAGKGLKGLKVDGGALKMPQLPTQVTQGLSKAKAFLASAKDKLDQIATKLPSVKRTPGAGNTDQGANSQTYTQLGQAAGGLGSAPLDYASKKDESEANKLRAQAEIIKGAIDELTELVSDFQKLMEKALETEKAGDDARRDAFKAASSGLG